MDNEKVLSTATKKYYEDLIHDIGDDYFNYRWKNHPVNRSHYRHTKKSVEFSFSLIDGTANHLLEIGSGPGTWTDICLSHTRKMTIVDISSEMLKVVRERFKNYQIELVCGDFISDEVLLPNGINVIFSARALEYMDNKRAMVSKSCEILTDKGFLVIITKNPRWMDKVKESLQPAISYENDILQSDWIEWSELEEYYRENGLKNVVTYPVCFGSYNAPLNNFISIKLCDLLHSFMFQRKISTTIDFLVESYMTIGQKI
ncbi:MAG: methyltransferase domain-containing protein [Desulfuromonadaceae bacterium]|nr:methyltransferase domain-containing protein [Desulfuromonadaceae bacterium]